MSLHLVLRSIAAAVIVATIASPALAQPAPVHLRGRVIDGESQQPIPYATVIVEERNITVVTDDTGAFAIADQPAGEVHLRISATGFRPLRQEISLAAGMAPLEVALKDDLHYAESVSVSPQPRDPFESYQPTSVLSGQELSIKLDSSLGGLLRNEPGVSERSLGPGPSRPIIRGQDGDRVLVLQNSQRTGDLSSQSADHGVTLNPAAATQVEVVRGPATLLYGANAIGGLVNVISNQIPTRPVTTPAGSTQVDVASNAGQAGAAADLSLGNGAWALNVGGSGRRSGDYATPLGDVDNSHSRGAFGSVGVARTSQRSYFGASVSVDDTRYGVPVVEGGQIDLTPRRQVYGTRGEVRDMPGFFTSARGAVAFHRYRHEELEGDEIHTAFRNNLLDVDLRATHRPAGRLTGTLGVSGYARSFEAVGDEALSPPIDQTTFGLFSYEEISWPHFTLQFGGRYDRASYAPEGGLRPRDFNNVSFSTGALFRPTDRSTLAVSVARAARNPALEELYFFGEHAGNLAFEIGNVDLDSEVAYGVDLSYRVRLPRFSGEVTYFNNTIDNYIFRNPISEEDFDARFGELDEERHGHEEDGDDHGHGEELPIVEYIGRDARLQGVEAHADIDVTHGFHLELGLDTVRGRLRDTSDALPRIPPVRLTGGVRYHRNALQLGAQVVRAAEQNRVYGIETPTDGYTTLKLFGAYSLQTGRLLHTFTARLDNVANELYRNHLSLIKDIVPEMGRSARIVWGVRF